LMCGLARVLKTDLAFGYMAICEYNSKVSPQDGTSPGYDHILDLDSRYQGEPTFNTCRRLTTLIDQAAVWADLQAPQNERVGLKGNLHLSLQSETYKLPSPVVTPLTTFVPKDFFESKSGITPEQVEIQRGWNDKYLKNKRETHFLRECKWGITDPRDRGTPMPEEKLEGVWKAPADGSVPAAVGKGEGNFDEDHVKRADDAPDYPANKTSGDNSATTSVGDLPMEREERSSAKHVIKSEDVAEIKEEHVVEDGTEQSQSNEGTHHKTTKIEMIHKTYSLGNKPEGTGPSPHLASNLAVEGKLGSLIDPSDIKPEAIEIGPNADGRDFKTVDGARRSMTAMKEDQNRSTDIQSDPQMQKALADEQMSHIYLKFDTFSRSQAEDRSKLYPKPMPKKPPPELPAKKAPSILLDTLPPVNAAIVQQSARMAALAKGT